MVYIYFLHCIYSQYIEVESIYTHYPAGLTIYGIRGAVSRCDLFADDLSPLLVYIYVYRCLWFSFNFLLLITARYLFRGSPYCYSCGVCLVPVICISQSTDMGLKVWNRGFVNSSQWWGFGDWVSLSLSITLLFVLRRSVHQLSHATSRQSSLNDPSIPLLSAYFITDRRILRSRKMRKLYHREIKR